MEKRLDEIKDLLKNATNFELQGKYKDAIAQLEKALKLNPDDGNIYNRLGDLYLKINKVKEAINSFEKGIEAFRKDNLLRNALALCKKILRYDPGISEINLTIAQLLIELDEKSDAAMYLFSYIERQMSAGNKREVMRAMEILKNLKLSDSTMKDRMVTIYETVGEKKKAEEIKQEIPPTPPEPIPSSSTTAPEARPLITKEEIQPISNFLERETIDRFEKLKDELENILREIRRAMRVDEVVVAIDKSFGILANQQREAMSLFQKALENNLESLEKAVRQLAGNSSKNLEDLERLLSGLAQSINEINRNQRMIAQEISKNLESIGTRFESTTDKMLEELHNLTVCYESASKNVLTKVDENCTITSSLLKVSSDTKIGIQTINESLLKYFLNQDAQIKKLHKFIYIIVSTLCIISILLLLILLQK
jgi:tetratricopeptide (TPR) repeat protein